MNEFRSTKRDASSSRFGFCDSCGMEFYSKSEINRGPQGEPLCDDCYGEQVFPCDNCGKDFYFDDLTMVGDYELYCDKCLKSSNLKESAEDIDDNNFDEDAVEEGNRFFAEGKDYTWDERIAGPIHLDFDNWAVWSAVESVNILDYATEKPDGGYEVDKDAFMKAYMEAPVAYFVVDEDTGFIDWGPCDTDIEAKDFLNSKKDDWENDGL